MTKKKPSPGSPAAVKAGCQCAVLDNNHGKGIGGGLFWINRECPLHGTCKRLILCA